MVGRDAKYVNVYHLVFQIFLVASFAFRCFVAFKRRSGALRISLIIFVLALIISLEKFFYIRKHILGLTQYRTRFCLPLPFS